MNPALSSLHAGCLLGWLNGCCAVVVSIAMLIVSIILEAAVAAIAVLAAQQGRPYLYGLAFTFAAYVLYDLARLLQWPVEGALLSGLFLLATVTALFAVTALYREGRKG